MSDHQLTEWLTQRLIGIRNNAMLEARRRTVEEIVAYLSETGRPGAAVAVEDEFGDKP